MIPVNEPLLDGNELKYVRECIESGWISSEGPFVGRFEEEFSRYVHRQHGVAVTNGSAALEAAIVALGIGKGDEVIIPAFTIISCANAVVRAGAVPVLVDCDARTWNMDVGAIEDRITARTRAIMAVHIYGLPVDMDPLLEIARKRDLIVIEDAAEVIGQTYRGKPCGSFGDVSVFSFYPNKHVTTGEGGMIVTDDPAIADRCRSLRNLCFQQGRRFVHEEMGWNLRMTNLQAAVGVAQLEKLEQHLQTKRHIGQTYNELLAGIDNLTLPAAKTDFAENIYWVYGLILEGRRGPAAEMMERLARKGIGTRPFFWPMHQQPVFASMGLFHRDSHPTSEHIARQGFYIPSGLALTDRQMQQVAAAVREALN